MQDRVITGVEQVTTEWLTSILAANGALTRGSVASFELSGGEGNWSSNATLELKFTEEASGALPQRLFLKMVNADAGDDEFFGESEVRYYTHDYLDVEDAPLIHCYHAVHSEELKRYHVLLDDVSETHVRAAEREPTLDYGLALAEGLATLHSRWWGADRLSDADAPIHSAGHIQRFVDIAEPEVSYILGHSATELGLQWPDAHHMLCAKYRAKHRQALIERTEDDNGFTLIHGDVGPNNILVPRDGNRPLYIIDRQPFDSSLTTWLGVYDLVYATMLEWDIEARRQYEIPLLKRYHQQLIVNGVADYSWEQLYDDYRLCVAMGVYILTEYCHGRLNERWIHVWLPILQRALTAFDDLDCRALW